MTASAVEANALPSGEEVIMTNSLSYTRRIVICAALAAISAILGSFLKIPVNLFGLYSMKISLSVIPLVLASIYFGPLYGGIVGVVADVAGAIMVPMGAYNPLFSITGFCLGFVPGIFFARGREVTAVRVFTAVAVSQLFGSVLLNTSFMVLSYGQPWAIILPRFVNQLFHIPLISVCVLVLDNAIKKSGAFRAA